MKIINGLIIILSITQILSATVSGEFKLDAGSQQTIILGDKIDLHGKVLSGDKSKIDHYQWEENGKVIKNSSGDEIVYWKDVNAENGYVPKGKGNHIFKFVVVDTVGKKHVKRLLIQVDTKKDVYISQDKDLKFDLRPEFLVKREQRSEGNYRLSRGHYLEVKVGDVIPLSGVIDPSKKHLIDSYRWELHGKVLKNQLGDEIIYWDEENRENDYVPKKSGKEFLHFTVIDINGEKTSKTLLLKISRADGQDDYGDDIATATKIKLNKTIKGKYETKNDHDFFKFTIDKREYVRIVYTRGGGPRKVKKVLTSDGKEMSLTYSSIPASGGMYRANQTIFEPGTYYIELYQGAVDSYSLIVKAEDIVDNDEYGNTKKSAKKVTLNSKIEGYINNRKDIDYFYLIAPKTGTLTIKDTLKTRLLKINGSNHSDSFHVNKGAKYYFALTHTNSCCTGWLTQLKYKLSLSIK